MSKDVKLWDDELDEPHNEMKADRWWKFEQPLLEVFEPLTYDIVGNEERKSEVMEAQEGRDQVIHVCISIFQLAINFIRRKINTYHSPF